MSRSVHEDGATRGSVSSWSEPETASGSRAITLLTLLSHPIRSKMLRSMVHGEPMRVSDVARAVGEPANSVSYHMRKLAEAGVAQRCPRQEGDDGRETWWVVPDWKGLDFDPASIRDLPGGQAVVAEFERAEAAEILKLFSLRRIEAAQALGLPALRADGPLQLTRGEAEAFRDGVTALLAEAIDTSRRHSRQGRGQARGADGDDEIYTYDYRVALLPDIDPSEGPATEPCEGTESV